MDAPLSVVIPNYNHACYVEGALEALLSQSRPPNEVIVVDDGSTDASREVLEAWAARVPTLRLLFNGANRGAVWTINRGLKAASGAFVFCHSADDHVLPGFFEKALDLLARHPEAGLCTSLHGEFTDGATYQLSNEPGRWTDHAGYLAPDDLAAVLHGSHIPGHATVYRRTCVEEAGWLLEPLRWHCDWYMNFAIAAKHGVCYLPEVLSLLRVHPGTYSASGMNDPEQQREVLDALLALLRDPAHRDLVRLLTAGEACRAFGPAIVEAVVQNPEHWNATALGLVGPMMDPVARARFRATLAGHWSRRLGLGAGREHALSGGDRHVD